MNPQEYVFLPLLVFLVNGAVALYMVRRLGAKPQTMTEFRAGRSLKVKKRGKTIVVIEA